MRILLFGLSLVFAIVVRTKVDASAISRVTYVKINATNRLTKRSVQVCANIQPIFDNENRTKVLKRYTLSDITSRSDICDPSKTDPPDFYENILLDSYRYCPKIGRCVYFNERFPILCREECYNCSDDRIIAAQKLNASAFLFRVKTSYASFYIEEFNDTRFTIPMFYVNEHSYDQIEDLYDNEPERANELDMRILFFGQSSGEGALFVMLGMAMFCIIFGGLWSGYTHQQLLLFHAEQKKKAHVVDPAGSIVGGETENLDGAAKLKKGFGVSVEPASHPFSWCTLAWFILFTVGFLILMYYFNDFLIWFIIVLYTFSSSWAVYACFSFFLDKLCHYGKCGINFVLLAERLERSTSREWSGLKFFLEYRKILLYLCCAALSICWCIFRKHPYAFIVQDFLSICFCVSLLRQFRLPNLKWLTCLLSALLIYDLFMVFITPFFTKGGCSVMVEVATGGACSKQHLVGPPDPDKEDLPILFKVPRFDDPIVGCFNLTIDLQYPPYLLGLGDVIVPGLLVGFCYAFDLGWNVRGRVYFLTSVIGYLLGMIMTFVALLFMDTAQPALIYLVPFTLIPTHLLALLRKQWKLMWKGHYPNVEELNPMLNGSTDDQLNDRGVENNVLDSAADPPTDLAVGVRPESILFADETDLHESSRR